MTSIKHLLGGSLLALAVLTQPAHSAEKNGADSLR